jgi:hypothetical protein
MGKDLEGSGHGLIKVISWHLPAENKKNHENPLDGIVSALAKD